MLSFVMHKPKQCDFFYSGNHQLATKVICHFSVEIKMQDQVLNSTKLDKYSTLRRIFIEYTFYL